MSIAAEPAGANCAAGGSSVMGGVDNGQGGGVANDGVLSPGEVTSTNYICNGVDGAAGTAGAAGSNGIDGAAGVNGSNGVDGVDGAAGVDGTNGVDGAPGTNGSPGHNSLVKMTTVAAGPECASGGQRVDVGVDDGSGVDGIADDQVLESDEIDDTVYVCNGSDGASGSNGSNGSNGFDSLLRFSSEPVGAHCGEVGYRVDAGLDNGDGAGTARDGVLQDGEVDTTAYLCTSPAIIGVMAYGNTYSNQLLAVSLGDGSVTPLTTSNNFYVDTLAFGGGAVAYSGYDPSISSGRTTVRYAGSDYNLPVSQIYGQYAIAVHGPEVAYITTSSGAQDIVFGNYTTNTYASLTNNTDPNTYYQAVDFDADRIVYARVLSSDWVWRLYVYDRATQTETYFGDGYWPKIAGTHIVYNLWNDGAAVVYDIVAGTTTNMSTSVGSYGNYPVVSEGYAAFQTDNSLYVYAFASGALTPVASSYAFRFVDDTLVYLGDNSQTIYAYNPSTGVSRSVLHIDSTYFQFDGMP